MIDYKPRILLVNTYDVAGGAERLVTELLHGYRVRGYQSALAVGRKFGNDPDVFSIQNNAVPSGWENFWRRVQYSLETNHHSRLAKLAGEVPQWRQRVETRVGIENFDFPGSYNLLEQSPHRPNIVHAHNLHRDYFDLRALAPLSRQVPVIITLHDAWLLSGHCAHSFDCKRWQTGCGHCPDLSIYPSIQRDATRYNWQRKRRIYGKSSLYISTASQWLLDKIENSMLAASIKEARLIPNGVELSVFQPGNKVQARISLGLPQDKFVILLRARSMRNDRWKDSELMKSVIKTLSASTETPSLLFLALGQNAPTEHMGHTEIRFIPYQEDPTALVKYYQAADVYVHPARVDTFPLVVLEALACGLPVIGTAVAGVLEQIRDGKTGFLTPPGDPKSMIAAIDRLRMDPVLQKSMSQNASKDARERFDQDRHVTDYLTWYQEILEGVR